MREVLVDDESYAALYKDSPRGRPSIPPSLVVLTLLLQYYDDCSDREAEARLRFDLRWKPALGLGLGLGLEEVGFDATVLCRFRRKLLEHGLERIRFERLVQAARETGLLTKDAVQVVDSSHILGAAGVRETYTLIRGGIRKRLRALGDQGARPAGVSERLARYLDPEVPNKPDLDWADRVERVAYLQQLVTDARAALELVGPQPAGSAVQETAALLTKIVADDVEEGPLPPPKRRGRPPKATQQTQVEQVEAGAGSARDQAATLPEEPVPGPRLRQGVAPDRILSVVDPQMRWGHKSSQQRWAGDKVHLSEEPTSELITHVEVRPAQEHDAAPVVAFFRRQEATVGLWPKAVLCDGAFGTGDVRAELGELGMEVVAKLRPLTDWKHLGKDEFVIELSANEGRGSVTCPAGVTTPDRRMARWWAEPTSAALSFPPHGLRGLHAPGALPGWAGRSRRPAGAFTPRPAGPAPLLRGGAPAGPCRSAHTRATADLARAAASAGRSRAQDRGGAPSPWPAPGALSRARQDRGTYATWWIRHSVGRAADEQACVIHLPERLVTRLRKVRRIAAQLSQEKGGDPLPEQIAQAAGMPVEKVDGLLHVTEQPISLDALAEWATREGQMRLALADTLEDHGVQAPAEIASQDLVGEELHRALAQLTARERAVVILRYGIGDGRSRTLLEVGKELGISRERVRQLELAAFAKLRTCGTVRLLRDAV